MTIPSNPQPPKIRRRNSLRLFYLLVVGAIVTFTLAADVRPAAPQGVLMALGMVLAAAGIWSFLQFLKAADTHQKLINHDATSFAFAGSVALTLIFGLLQRFGFLLGASLLLPALMIALWSIGLILFSWRYQRYEE
jgi:hypothetical protein